MLQTMHALDTLDAATSLTAILRRFQLVRLLDHRIRQRKSPQNAETTQAEKDKTRCLATAETLLRLDALTKP
jgi:hypothetical protein